MSKATVKTIYVVPKPGLICRHPDTGVICPSVGGYWPDSVNTRRLIRCGDVTVGKPAPVQPAKPVAVEAKPIPVQAEKPAAKKPAAKKTTATKRKKTVSKKTH